MKILHKAALTAAVCLMAGNACAQCTCSPVFDAWARSFDSGFVNGVYKNHVSMLIDGINSIAHTQSSADNVNAANRQVLGKAESQASMQSQFLADDVNRRAEAEMRIADRMTKGQSLSQERILYDGSRCNDANSVSGRSMAGGDGNSRQLHLNDRELYAWKPKQGTTILEVRRGLQNSESKVRDPEKDQVPSIVPQNGVLTYPDSEYAAQVRKMTEMMVDPEAPLDSKGLNLGKGETAYNAANSPRELQQSLRKDAVLSMVNWYTGAYDAEKAVTTMLRDGRASSNMDNFAPDKDKMLSKAAVLSAYSQYFLSPGVSDHLNNSNAMSELYEVMSLMLVVQEERTRAAKLIAAMLAMNNIESNKRMQRGIDALSKAR